MQHVSKSLRRYRNGLTVVLVAISLQVYAAESVIKSGIESGPLQGSAQESKLQPSKQQSGEYIFRAAGCLACHTKKKDQPLAGGYTLTTPFGIFYSPNITPDKETGIGNWTLADFKRALREGKSPQGQHYYPAFPYAAYTQLTDHDISLLWQYLQTRPAIKRKNQQHDLHWYSPPRAFIWFWKWLYFTPGEYQTDKNHSVSWNRGAYLARAATHCSECHTPRNMLGGMKTDLYLAGARLGEDDAIVPNITPDKKTGIGRWSHGELKSYFKSGLLPDGDFAGGLMAEVIDNSLRHYTAEDIDALLEYLASVPAVEHALKKNKPKKAVEKEAWD